MSNEFSLILGLAGPASATTLPACGTRWDELISPGGMNLVIQKRFLVLFRKRWESRHLGKGFSDGCVPLLGLQGRRAKPGDCVARRTEQRPHGASLGRRAAQRFRLNGLKQAAWWMAANPEGASDAHITTKLN